MTRYEMSYESRISPEISLWRSVLLLAYQDAESRTHERKRAIHWLCAVNKHEEAALREVCQLADISAEAVIHWARQRYKSYLAAEKEKHERHRKSEVGVLSLGKNATAAD